MNEKSGNLRGAWFAVRSLRGFTLIELMIAVAVVAILAAIALPSYQDYVRRARRSDGKEALLRVQIEQEKWRTNNSSYTSTLSDLGLTSPSVEGYYTIAIAAGANGISFTATATATGSQASDSGCTPLTLTVAAAGETKGPAGCW